MNVLQMSLTCTKLVMLSNDLSQADSALIPWSCVDRSDIFQTFVKVKVHNLIIFIKFIFTSFRATDYTVKLSIFFGLDDIARYC